MNLFFWRRRGLDDFAEGIRPELEALPTPEPSGDLLVRILASRKAGTRVILPVVRETRPAPLSRIASAVAVAAVLLLLAVPIREWMGRDAQLSEVSAGAGFFGQVAFAQAPGGDVPGLPPMRLEHAGVLRPLAVQYERRVRDNTGRLTSALRSDVALTAAMIDGVAAWKVTSFQRDAATGQHRADIETTYVARDDLRLLRRSIHVAPYSRYAQINVEQRFAGDRVTGRMTTDGPSIGRGRGIARRLRPEFGPYFANAFGPFLLMAVPLSRDWRGSASLVGWAVVPNDVVVPIELRVEDEEHLQVPAGSFDCWRIAIRIGRREITYWARKSDGLGVRVLDESQRPTQGTHETVLTRFPMMLSHLVVVAALLQPSLREYSVDAGHSIVEFSAGFAFSRVKGRFTHSKGTILYDGAHPESSSITIVIDARTIDTGWPHRDEHLRTSDFFDVEKYPTIVFQSERLTPRGADWVMDGTLTMHGVTRPIAIPFRFPRPPTRSAESNWMVLDAEGWLRLARADFGIVGGSAFNSWFDKARAATMADSVDITLEIQGWSPDAQSLRSAGVEAALERIRTQGVQSQIDRLTDVKRTKSQAEFDAYLAGGDLVARGLIATGRVADAVALGRALTELYPGAARARLVYGVALAWSGDARGASRQCAKAKEIFKPAVVDSNEKFPQDDPDWYYLDQLARTVVEWGQATRAVPVARTVAELYPGIARAHTTLGFTLATSGDAKGAAEAYAKALAVDPNETRALEWRRRLRGDGPLEDLRGHEKAR